jgi:hypothetical protein
MVMGMTSAVISAARKFPSSREDQDHEQRTFDKIGGNGLDRGVDQRSAVQCCLGFDAGRQNAVDFAKFGVDRAGYGPAVGSDEHEGSANHRFQAVFARAPDAGFGPDPNVGNVPQINGHATTGRDRNLAKIGDAFHPAAGAHGEAFAVALDHRRAAAHIIDLNGVCEVAEGEAKGNQASGIGLHQVLLDVPANGIHAGNTR